MLNTRTSLGLAVTEQGITAVQIGISPGRRAVLHTVAVPFSDGLSLNEPERLGKELRKALGQNRIHASRCVVGLASAWIAAREKALPATDAESLRGILSIAAEQEFGSGPQELAFDYSRSSSDKGISALMVAAPQRVLGQLAAVARAAGLSVTAVTSSAVALTQATRGDVPPAGRLVLCLLPRGVELTAQSDQGVRLLRHLPVRLDGAGKTVEVLSTELRRILALAPGDSTSGPPRELLIWDSVGLDRSSLSSLGDPLGLASRLCGLGADLGLADSSVPAGGQFAQAAALACSAGQSLPIDFLHSRLAPPRKARLGRVALGAIAAAVLLVAAGSYLVLDLRAQQQAVAQLQGQLKGLEPARQQAQSLVDNVTFARTWYDRRPPFLDCILEITGGFPQEGRIWATNVTIREDMQAILTGKAVSESAVQEVRDLLMRNPNLANVQTLYVRQVSGTARDVSFSIGLSLRGAK